MNLIIEKLKEKLEQGIDKKQVRHFFTGVPVSLAERDAINGVIGIKPESTEINFISTGMVERERCAIRIVLIKAIQVEYNKDKTVDPAHEFLMHVMEGKNSNGELRNDSIRNIVRSNFKIIGGKYQEGVRINYDTNYYGIPSFVTAEMVVPQIGFNQQTVNT